MNMNIYIRDHNLIPGENNSLRQRRSMCQWKGICHDIGLNQRTTHFCKKTSEMFSNHSLSVLILGCLKESEESVLIRTGVCHIFVNIEFTGWM